MMKSYLVPCSQLHQPRFFMHFFTQTTLIHQARTDITIVISRINQNRNNLTINLTFHIDNRFLMANLTIINYCLNARNTLSNIPNFLCLLNIVYMSPSTLILWKISPMMLSTRSPTSQRFPTISFFLLLSLRAMSSIICIELLMQRYVLLAICILRLSSLLSKLSFTRLIPFPILLILRPMLWFLIIVLQLPYGFFQWYRLIKLNHVSKWYWWPTHEYLNLCFLVLKIRHISQNLQESTIILLIDHRTHFQLMKLLCIVIIVPFWYILLPKESL